MIISNPITDVMVNKAISVVLFKAYLRSNSSRSGICWTESYSRPQRWHCRRIFAVRQQKMFRDKPRNSCENVLLYFGQNQHSLNHQIQEMQPQGLGLGGSTASNRRRSSVYLPQKTTVKIATVPQFITQPYFH